MMKTMFGVGLIGILFSLATFGADEEWKRGDTGIVNGTNVNVRGQARLDSDVITRVNIGTPVTVLEEVLVETGNPNEPEHWLKIKMPDNTPVWVSALFIHPDTLEVTATRLNVRSGPGENFSVVDRVPEGTKVEKIQQQGDWIEIVQTPSAYAFVAAQFIDRSKPSTTEVAEASEPVTPLPAEEEISTPTETTEPVESTEASEETLPVIILPEDSVSQPEEDLFEIEISDVPPLEENQIIEVPIPDLPQESPGKVIDQAPERVVIREGTVTPTRSIQAPTHYALKSIETGKLINYLYEEGKELDLKNMRGQSVRVIGRELVDPRWPRTPVLEIERIHLLR